MALQVVSSGFVMLQSLSWMYLSCQENMSKPGAGACKRIRTRTGVCPLWQCHCSRVSWGLTLGCAGELSTWWSILSILSMAAGSLGTVLEPGERHYGNLELLSTWSGGSGTQDSHWHSSWKAGLRTSNTHCAPWLATTRGAGYNFFSTVHSAVLWM